MIMQNILHDLEEDYDPYYSRYGVPGSNLDTNRNEADEIAECAERIGAEPMPVIMEDRLMHLLGV